MTRRYVLKNPPSPEYRAERARAAGKAAHSPVTLAKRLKPRIAELTEEQWSELVAAREGANGS